jgi:hypothetical protein
MERTKVVLPLVLALLALTTVTATNASAQESYASETDEYTLELPTQTWKAVPHADAVHEHTEYINGERNNGYLRIRKEVVAPGTSLRDFARADQDTKLRFQPGYVAAGKPDENFAGRLRGVVMGYEYTSAGKTMAGRVYYLQADPRTIYVLHFTGLRDKLQRIQNQTDAIARSFRPK